MFAIVVSLTIQVIKAGDLSFSSAQEMDRNRGFILSPPQSAVLPRSDAGSDGVEPAPCFVI